MRAEPDSGRPDSAGACARSQRGRHRRRAGTQSRVQGALFAPAGGFGDVLLGRRADDEAHASAGLVKAPLDAHTNDRPALSGIRVTLEVDKTTIEFGDLRLCERELAILGRDGVPEIPRRCPGDPPRAACARRRRARRCRDQCCAWPQSPPRPGLTEHPSGGHWLHEPAVPPTWCAEPALKSFRHQRSSSGRRVDALVRPAHYRAGRLSALRTRQSSWDRLR